MEKRYFDRYIYSTPISHLMIGLKIELKVIYHNYRASALAAEEKILQKKKEIYFNNKILTIRLFQEFIFSWKIHIS